MKTWNEGGDFRARVLEDTDISAHLTRDRIESAFSLDTYMRNVDAIFARVFDAEAA
jgi:adenylosuccinate lyase